MSSRQTRISLSEYLDRKEKGRSAKSANRGVKREKLRRLSPSSLRSTLRLFSASCSEHEEDRCARLGCFEHPFWAHLGFLFGREKEVRYAFFGCRFKTCLLSVALVVPSLLAATIPPSATEIIIGVRKMKPEGRRRRPRRRPRRRSRRPRSGENEAKHRRREIHSRFRDSVTVPRRFQSADGFCGLPKVKRSERV